MRFFMIAMALILLTACGGESDEPLSESDYRSQLVEISQPALAANGRIGELLDEVVARPALATNSDWESEYAQSLDTVSASLDDLRGLNPPPAYAESHKAFLRAVECSVDGSKRLQESFVDDTGAAIAGVNGFLESCGDLWQDALDAQQQITPTAN